MPSQSQNTCRLTPRSNGSPSPACPTTRSSRRTRKYIQGKGGAIVVFGITGGAEAGMTFLEALELHSHLANLGGAKSFAIHPATTTHSQLNEEQQAAAGITPELVRPAVGIETIEDIPAGLDQALAKATA